MRFVDFAHFVGTGTSWKAPGKRLTLMERLEAVSPLPTYEDRLLETAEHLDLEGWREGDFTVGQLAEDVVKRFEDLETALTDYIHNVPHWHFQGDDFRDRSQALREVKADPQVYRALGLATAASLCLGYGGDLKQTDLESYTEDVLWRASGILQTLDFDYNYPTVTDDYTAANIQHVYHAVVSRISSFQMTYHHGRQPPSPDVATALELLEPLRHELARRASLSCEPIAEEMTR